ncbi:MAG: proton-conducting transporter membrane subunit [Bacillota bacterium]|nr:proton-conducting transporter membrane subunit [Bacillota bacterium]HHU30960.1 hypothetical protein [Bacillota bacterium]
MPPATSLLFFFFFVLMSIISYVLVIHEETPEALQAGFKYLIMTIIGGLALFFGIMSWAVRLILAGAC